MPILTSPPALTHLLTATYSAMLYNSVLASKEENGFAIVCFDTNRVDYSALFLDRQLGGKYFFLNVNCKKAIYRLQIRDLKKVKGTYLRTKTVRGEIFDTIKASVRCERCVKKKEKKKKKKINKKKERQRLQKCRLFLFSLPLLDPFK